MNIDIAIIVVFLIINLFAVKEKPLSSKLDYIIRYKGQKLS